MPANHDTRPRRNIIGIVRICLDVLALVLISVGVGILWSPAGGLVSAGALLWFDSLVSTVLLSRRVQPGGGRS